MLSLYMAQSIIHPITVHIPLALPVFLPFIVAYTWGRTKVSKDRSQWNWTVLSYALLLICSSLAFWTGEQDSFNSPASADAMLAHEHVAKYFIGACATGLLLSAIIRWIHRLHIGPIALALEVQSVAQLALAIWVGHIGGDLVFH